jgi:dsDNA-specific endonuclease/ATPase MutS2
MSAPFVSAQTSSILALDYCLAELRPASPYGQGLKQGLKPFLPGQEAELEREFDALEQMLAILNTPSGEAALDAIYHNLTQIPDWRESLDRAAAGGVLTEVELFGLKKNLYYIRSIAGAAQPLGNTPWPQLPEEVPQELLYLLDPEGSGSPAFYISDSYSTELAYIREKLRSMERRRRTARQAAVAAVTSELPVAFNPAGEIPVPRHEINTHELLQQTGKFSVSRETYTETYYSLKPSAEETYLAEELEEMRRAEELEEERVRKRLSLHIKSKADTLYRIFAALAYLDLLLAKARLARRWQCTRPEVRNERVLSLTFIGARHPKVEQELSRQGRSFSPVSLDLKGGLAVITGANMGGKTVTLRTAGLLAAMAAFGLFVPAESLKLTLFNHVAILAGDYDVELTGLSRFGQEVAGLNDILPLRDRGSLILLDELAASTNPAEGSALAQAVAEHLREGSAVSVLTTHYALLARLAGADHWQVIGLSKASKKDLEEALSNGHDSHLKDLAQLMNYSLEPVNTELPIPREAVRVASYLGLSQGIVARARQLIDTLKGGEYIG